MLVASHSTLQAQGSTLHADQYTGRLFYVPNAVMFTEPVANYTEGSDFIWHEILVLVTFESDWEAAKAIILEEIQAIAATTA
jgi:small-conductance mechanosensitive channel